MSARLRVVVADDERPARSFLLSLLRAFDDVAVVGEAASGKEAVALIEKERPDLALLDWQMPELDGIGVVRMPNAQLIIYPDSNHGAHHQYPELFVEHATLFLNA